MYLVFDWLIALGPQCNYHYLFPKSSCLIISLACRSGSWTANGGYSIIHFPMSLFHTIRHNYLILRQSICALDAEIICCWKCIVVMPFNMFFVTSMYSFIVENTIRISSARSCTWKLLLFIHEKVFFSALISTWIRFIVIWLKFVLIGQVRLLFIKRKCLYRLLQYYFVKLNLAYMYRRYIDYSDDLLHILLFNWARNLYCELFVGSFECRKF